MRRTVTLVMYSISNFGFLSVLTSLFIAYCISTFKLNGIVTVTSPALIEYETPNHISCSVL